MCKYVKLLAGKIFMYINKKMYCFDGKYGGRMIYYLNIFYQMNYMNF